MMGTAEKFDRALPELETFLEGEVAKGETRETRLLSQTGICEVLALVPGCWWGLG